MRHALLFVGSLGVASGCGDSTKDDFGLPLPTEIPTEANAKPSSPEISVSLSAVTVGGLSAADGLVYGVHNAQGALLGRLDGAGKIELSTPYRKFLIRRRYDEVEIVDVAGSGPVQVQLVPISERPETVNIFGVGLESILHRGELFFEAQGDILMGVTYAPEEPSRAVCINAKTGVTREIAVVEMTPDTVVYEILAIGNGVFAVYIAENIYEDPGPGAWQMFLVDGASQTVLAERSGVGNDLHAFGKGRAGELVMLGPDGDTRKLDYFLVDESLEVTSQTYDFEEVGLGEFSQRLANNDVIVGVANGEVFIRASFGGLHIVDSLSGTNRFVQPEVEMQEPLGFWFNDGVVHRVDINGNSLIYSNSAGQRKPFDIGATPSEFGTGGELHGRGSAATILLYDIDSPRSFFLNTATETLREYTEDFDAVGNASPFNFRVYTAGEAFALVSFGVAGAFYLELQPDGTGLTVKPIPGLVDPRQCFLTGVYSDWENRWSDDFAQISNWARCGDRELSKAHLIDTQSGLQRSHFVSPARLQKSRDGSRIFGRLVKDNENAAVISFDPDAPQ